MAADAHLPDQAGRSTGVGFLLAGMLMGVVGPLTVAWRYELDKDPRAIGLHFLAFNAALLICGVLSQRLLRRASVRLLLAAACLVASIGFAELTIAAPPAHSAWRILGVSIVGGAAGFLLTSLLNWIRPSYEVRAASVVNFSSLMFGAGCLLVTAIIGGTYSVLGVRWQTLVLIVVPLMVLPLMFRGSGTIKSDRRERRPRDGSFSQLRSPAVILFSLLLLFQFGNEWSLATWLPLFLIHRLGVSPQSSIFVLGLYFLALIAGRAMAQMILPRVSHRRLLFVSTSAAMLGYLLLSLTESTFGAALATVVTGLAFAPIYSLVAEKIGHRFDYQPGFFNGIFSLAVTGGMLMPWALGFAGYFIGMQYVLLIPAMGTVAVLILVLLIMLEAKLMRSDFEAVIVNPGEKPKAAATSASRGV